MNTKVKGQDTLIKELSRIFSIFKTSMCEIRPHFILTGESGSGKSYTIQTLCTDHKINYIDINAAALTKEGTSGNSLSKALSELRNVSTVPTVCFVDEFDKLFIAGNSNTDTAHETTTGVQNEFLKVLESESISVFADYGKYTKVKANNVLFIFAGAFNGQPDIGIEDLRSFGVKTEFLGRVGLIFNTAPLTIDTLYAILEESLLFKKYVELFKSSANFDDKKALAEIKASVTKLFENNTLGARMLNTLIHQYFIKGKITEETEKKISFKTKLKF